MRFFTAASVLFAAAIAAPTPAPQTSDCPNPAHCGEPADPSKYENVNISDYYLRKNNGIQAAGFKLQADDGSEVSCEIGKVDSLPSNVVTCGDSDYRFGLVESTDGSSDAGIALYHQTGQFSGKWGTGNIPTYCHAGGNGPDDFVCQQVNQVTIVISS